MKTIPTESDPWQVAGDQLEYPAPPRHVLTLNCTPKAFGAQPSTFNQLRAFTIVELLVVIAIIGILAAMLLPVLSKARITAQKKQAAIEISQIATAIQQYDSVYGRFPVSAAAQSQAVKNAQIPGGNPDITYGGWFQTPAGPSSVGTLDANGVVMTNSEVIAILMDLTNCPNGARPRTPAIKKIRSRRFFSAPRWWIPTYLVRRRAGFGLSRPVGQSLRHLDGFELR